MKRFLKFFAPLAVLLCVATMTSCEKDTSGEAEVEQSITFELSSLSQNDIPEENIWIITDQTIEDIDSYTELRAALYMAADEGREISIEFPNLESIVGTDEYTLGAFYGCTALVSASFPVVKEVGDYALCFCEKLKYLSMPEAIYMGIYSVGYCYSLTSLALPEVLTTEAAAFGHSTSLVEISLPKATTIGSYAFVGCTALTSIDVNIESYLLSDGVLYDAQAEFLHTYLQSNTSSSFTAPQSVIVVGNYAFYDCAGLESITIPGSGVGVASVAFYGCEDLTTVSIPSATILGYCAFAECASLTTLNLATDTFLRYIGDQLTTLENVTLTTNSQNQFWVTDSNYLINSNGGMSYCFSILFV